MILLWNAQKARLRRALHNCEAHRWKTFLKRLGVASFVSAVVFLLLLLLWLLQLSNPSGSGEDNGPQMPTKKAVERTSWN